jgi:hypothetical protein
MFNAGSAFRLLVVASLVFLLGARANADAVGYGAVVDLRAESPELEAVHHHDWSKATREGRWKMVSTRAGPFTPENTWSRLRVVVRSSGMVLFDAAVPPLTHLWISPDSRYVVGLSRIQAWNDVQLVAFARDGRLLLSRGIHQANTPGAMSTVTNFTFWYREPTPRVELREERRPDGQSEAVLTVEGNAGSDRVYRFPAAH